MEPSPQPIVSADRLREQMSDAGLVVADVRWVPGGSARQAFQRGHLPGAVFVDVDRDLARPAYDGPGRHPLPTPEAFAETMGSLGIGDGTPVVAYDDVRGSIAARLWWMLDAIGHPVTLLDGGIDAWDAPLENGPGRVPPPSIFTPKPWPRERIVDARQVAAALRDPAMIVLDARAGERYRGDVEPFDRAAGHIPGARSSPWTEQVEPDSGHLLEPGAMAERFAALGVTDATHAIAQCGSGVTACHTLLAMRVAGLGAGLLYEGSWSDWSSDPDRPVAVGRDPGELG